jgi:hypothetical protein
MCLVVFERNVSVIYLQLWLVTRFNTTESPLKFTYDLLASYAPLVLNQMLMFTNLFIDVVSIIYIIQSALGGITQTEVHDK